MTVLSVYQLGLVEYQQAFELQDKLRQERIGALRTDSLLLLEHPPTLTMGRTDDVKNLLVSPSALKDRGVSIYRTDRGGSVTWHGPGQLVAYPILDLRNRGMDIHKYIHDLEEVIIRTLKTFSISSERDADHIGVWTGSEKIASIGVNIKKWVTKHGFAINISSDLSHFSLINPCGISDRSVTAMTRILNHDVSVDKVGEVVINEFAAVFGMVVKMEGSDGLDLQSLL